MLSEIEQFVNWVRRRNPQARTWKDYNFDLRQFTAQVGACPPGAVTFREVDRFVDAQRSKGFQPTTINRRLAALVSFYTFLSDEDPDLVCPVVPRRHYLRERERLPRPVQEDGLRAFFAAINETPPPKGEPDNRIRDRAIFILRLRCGLHIGEVAGLQLADLYLSEPHPRLVTHGKGSRERSVYLSPQAEKALRAYLKERPTAACNTIFLSYQKAGLSTTAIHKRLNTTLTYARVHDQTVAEDYYTAMSSVEKRLDLLEKEEEKPQEMSESERGELLALTDQLLSPKLSLELCLEVATRMRTVLRRKDSIPFTFQNEKILQRVTGILCKRDIV